MNHWRELLLHAVSPLESGVRIFMSVVIAHPERNHSGPAEPLPSWCPCWTLPDPKLY